jgi:serine protease Do
MNQLTLAVGDLKPGEKAVFSVLRDGKAQDITVTIEERKDETAAENGKLWPGVYVSPITDAMKESLKLKSADGLYVGQVIAKSPAAVVGLLRQDIITAVNGVKVKDLPSYYKALREKTQKELWFEVQRGDATLETPKYKR